jgi:vitamin B12 transporter
LDYGNTAFFLQDSMDLLDNRVNLIAAARYDRFDMQTKHPDSGHIADFNEKSETYDHISPKFGVGVKFLEELLRVRANIGEGFRSPSADQLSADHVHDGTHYLGNPDLDPETSLTYDLGIDFMHEFATINLGYFHTDYKDKIVEEYNEINGINTRTYVNHGEAEIAGFDLGVEWWIGRQFDWNVDLSLWSNATFNTTKEDKETNEDLLNISDHELKSGLNVNYRNFSTQLSYVLVGPQMITNYDEYPNVDEEKDSFDFWDLTMRYNFLKHWQVRASILNLFDDRVEWARGYLMPERNYRVGVSYTF